MKAFITLATAAVAAAAPAPEADPQILLGKPLVYNQPIVHQQVLPAVHAVPAVQAVHTPVQTVTYTKPVEVKTEVKPVEVKPVEVSSYKVQTPVVAATQPIVYANQVPFVHKPVVYNTPVATTQYVAPTQYAVPAVATQYAYQPVANKVYHAKNGQVEHTVINKREADPVDFVNYPTGAYSSLTVPTLKKTLRAYNKYPVHQAVVPATYAHHAGVYAHPAAYQTPVAAYNTPYTYHF